ncbi:MAG: hypothetical protein SVZ03_10835 [Spirochaetota bacterium]|nr:hypothetical protein [Spirochaetota bacterium]
MGDKDRNENNGIVKEFNENPYNPESKRPEEIVRIFYINNVSIVPVVSKRGMLLGILRKDEVISELSDIERVNKQKIDQFIKKLAKKMSLDELLAVVGRQKEFVVINLFGEIHGNWSRLKLFAACEQGKKGDYLNEEIEKQQEEQILEWMIYLILEHIPRPLYALNNKGKTIFYNSYFEEIFENQLKRDVDIKLVEESLSNSNKNELYSKKRGSKEVYFYNKDMKFYYEKVPLVSKGEIVGFLIYYDKSLSEDSSVMLPGIDMEGMSLKKMLESIERLLIVEAIRGNSYNLKEVAKNLRVTEQFLHKRIEKYGIDIKRGVEK